MTKLADKAKKILDGLKRRFIYRSSVTGRFVTKSFAEGNPDTTQKEEV